MKVRKFDPGSWSKLLALHSLDDAHSWAFDDRSLDTAPQLAQCRKKTFGLVEAVEFEIDDGVVWIVNRPQDPVATYARLLPIDRVAVECLLPGIEVGDGVLDLQDDHAGSFLFRQSCIHESLGRYGRQLLRIEELWTQPFLA